MLFNLRNLENVLQRNLRTVMARECIFRASGGTRFKNFHQTWWRKGGVGTPRCNWPAQKNSGYVTDYCIWGYCDVQTTSSVESYKNLLCQHSAFRLFASVLCMKR